MAISSLISGSIKSAIAPLKNEDRKFPMLSDQSHAPDDHDNFLKNEILINISERFSFIKDESKNCFLIDKHKTIGIYLAQKIKKHYPIDENDTTPLLICEPFRNTSKELFKFFPFLRELGLELDRIEDDTVILRAIPEFLTHLPIEAVLGPIFELLINQKGEMSKNCILEQILKKLYAGITLSEDSIQNRFFLDIISNKELELELFIKEKAIIKIDHKTVLKMMSIDNQER
jgi:DNA mismatch repair ATPase MutL